MLIRLFTSKCAFYVGDSTAKVVNSEQITTFYNNAHSARPGAYTLCRAVSIFVVIK